MSAIDIALSPGSSAPPDVALLGPQTAGILLRNIERMYRRHFVVLMVGSLLPVLPGIGLLLLTTLSESPLVFLGVLAYTVGAFVSSGAMTVAISDICLGNRPTLARAYARILGQRRWWHMLWSGLLLSLFMYAGLLLLVLPGFWVMARGFLTSIVVALEGRKGMEAIRRSFALTKGQAWRIAGLTMLPLLLVYVFMVVVVAVITIAGAFVLDPGVLLYVMMALQFGLSVALFAPVLGITMVLLYYDQRVRREAYDARTLSEDLMR